MRTNRRTDIETNRHGERNTRFSQIFAIVEDLTNNAIHALETERH